MTLLLAGAAGILLAATAGLRAFLPLLGLGLAARFLDWPIAESMQWLSTNAALVGLAVAALVEIAADKIPAVDHVLDAVHTVVGPLTGALVAFTAWGELSKLASTCSSCSPFRMSRSAVRLPSALTRGSSGSANPASRAASAADLPSIGRSASRAKSSGA